MPSGGANIKSVPSHRQMGNYRPSRHGHRAKDLDVSHVGSIGEPPKHLNSEAQQVWREVLGSFESLCVVCALDRLLLETLCVLVVANRAEPRASTAAQIRLALIEFGMSPVARARLGSKLESPEPETSALDGLVGGDIPED